MYPYPWNSFEKLFERMTHQKISCGYLFCEQHSRFYTKVNQEAQHDPVHGIWCRVCERCYTCREGYNEIDGIFLRNFQSWSSFNVDLSKGAHRTWTDYLRQIRRGKVERTLLESNLLEKRLDKVSSITIYFEITRNF
jgi:hypothetical protein